MFPLHKKKTISTTTKYLQRKKLQVKWVIIVLEQNKYFFCFIFSTVPIMQYIYLLILKNLVQSLLKTLCQMVSKQKELKVHRRYVCPYKKELYHKP